MMNPKLFPGIAVGLATLLAGCASTPQQNPKVEEARALYDTISEDPNVARSGAVQLRSAETDLKKAQELLDEGAASNRVEQAAYLANRHAQIAQQQGMRAKLEDEVGSAEARREQLRLQMKTREAEQAHKRAEALQAQMAALQAEKTERGMVLTLGDVLFDVNKAELKASAERTIGGLADFMKQYENRRVRIEGYTDSTGAEEYNQQLSERRAMAVRDALTNHGISRSRIDVQGYGEAYPVATNETRAGRQLNRRVEIVISDETGRLKDRS